MSAGSIQPAGFRWPETSAVSSVSAGARAERTTAAANPSATATASRFDTGDTVTVSGEARRAAAGNSGETTASARAGNEPYGLDRRALNQALAARSASREDGAAESTATAASGRMPDRVTAAASPAVAAATLG